MIKKVRIVNFKCIKGCFEVCFTEGISILVGNNESGKSTVLEAVHMALSGIFRGKSIKNNLTQYLFNYDVVKQYLSDVNSGHIVEAPYILIELYMDQSLLALEGDRYSDKTVSGRVSGIGLKIALDEKYSEEYGTLMKAGSVQSLPIEYYDVE